MTKFAVMLLAAASLTAVSSAQATVTVSTTPLQVVGTGALVVDFDNAVAPGYSFVGTGTVDSVSVGGMTAQPAGDQTSWYTVHSGESATFTSATALNNIQVYVGSIDGYNTFEVLGQGGNVIQTFTGNDLSPTHDGNWTDGNTNRLVSFDLTGAAAPVYGMKFSSSGNSLEFDNISVSGAPEPAAWALMMVAVGGMGSALRTRRRKAVAA